MGPQSILKSHSKITTYCLGNNLNRTINSVIPKVNIPNSSGQYLEKKLNALTLNVLEGNGDTFNWDLEGKIIKGLFIYKGEVTVNITYKGSRGAQELHQQETLSTFRS